MLSALLLSVCTTGAVLYDTDLSGPPCADYTAECRCNECVTWEAAPRATSYRVERKAASSSDWYAVGNVAAQTTEEGTIPAPTTWCVARDSSFPRRGVLYDYRVIAVNAAGESGPSATVQYRGAPYWCGDDSGESQCYVGDAKVTP